MILATTKTPARSNQWIGLVLILITGTVIIFYYGQQVTFVIDEWQLIQSRTTPSASSLLDPFNNHLMAIPIGFTQIFYHIFGISSHFPYRALQLIVHLGAATVLFVYLKQRTAYWVALSVTAVFVLYGYTAAILIWPISLGWTLAILGGISALLLLDRRSLAADLAASAALLVCVASTSVGIAFVIGVAVELIAARHWRRLWIVGVPLASYLIWYATFSDSNTKTSSLSVTLRFTQELRAQTIGTLLGVQARGVAADATLVVVVVGLGFAWLRLGKPHSARLLGIAATLVTMVGALAVGRASSGLTPWFSYAVGVVLIILVIELFSHSRPPSQFIQVLIVIIALWAIIWNVGQLNNEAKRFREISETEKTQLAALASIETQVPNSFMPGPFLQTLTAGRYKQVVIDFGTPAFSVAEAKRAKKIARRNGDETLVRGLNVRPLAGAAETLGIPVAKIAVRGGTISEVSGCTQIVNQSEPTTATLKNPSLAVTVEPVDGKATVYAGILSPGSQFIGELNAGERALIKAPAVPSLGQWTLKIVATGNVRICSASQ